MKCSILLRRVILAMNSLVKHPNLTGYQDPLLNNRRTNQTRFIENGMASVR